MLDKELIKVMDLFDYECIAPDRDKQARKKTDIYLKSLNNEVLNDLVIIIKAGKYDEFRKEETDWIEAKRTLAFDDLNGWSKQIGAVRLSDDQCIKYIRQWSPVTVIDNIRAFISIEPMTYRQQALIKKVNETRVNNRMKHQMIETR